jgi:hypothetical protein
LAWPIGNHKLTSKPMNERFSSLDKLCMPETIRTSNISWLTIVELVVVATSS